MCCNAAGWLLLVASMLPSIPRAGQEAQFEQQRVHEEVAVKQVNSEDRLGGIECKDAEQQW